MNKNSSQLERQRLFEKNLATAWPHLAIVKLPKSEAVSLAFNAFELMIRASQTVPDVSDVVGFVSGLNGLNTLIRQILDLCPDEPVTRESLKALAYELSDAKGRASPGIEGLALGSLSAFFIRFAHNPDAGVRIEYHDDYSVVVSVTDEHSFRQESWTAQLWEEISIEAFTNIEALVASAQNNVEAADAILARQTFLYPMDDSWQVVDYTVGDWKKVLRHLIALAVAGKMRTNNPEVQVIVIPLESFPAKLAAELDLSENKVRMILEHMTLDPRDKISNLAQTPFVRVGEYLLSSSSIMLLRRADAQLLKQWIKKGKTSYDRVHGKLTERVHERLAEGFRRIGCEAWANVPYALVGDKKKSDIDVLVKDLEDSWLVVELKNTLLPNPTSEPLHEIAEYSKAQTQISDALTALQKAPKSIFERFKNTAEKKHTVKACYGLYVATHTYGVPSNESNPSVELVTLNYVLENLSHSVTVMKIVEVLRTWRPFGDKHILSEIVSSSGFVLRFPAMHSANPINKVMNKLQAWWMFHGIRHKVIKS